MTISTVAAQVFQNTDDPFNFHKAFRIGKSVISNDGFYFF